MTFRDKIMRAALALLLLACLSIAFRSAVLRVVVGKFHIMEGPAIEWLVGGTHHLEEWRNRITDKPKHGHKQKKIDWAKLYPFPEGGTASFFAARNSMQNKEHTNIINLVDFLPLRDDMIRAKGRMEKEFGISIRAKSEGVWVQEIADGYLTHCWPQCGETMAIALSLADFAAYCQTQGADFLYVQAPIKVSRQDKNIDSVVDFSNDNVDAVLAQLQEQNVSYLDLRKGLASQHEHLYEAFFRTDHHWLPETGLWAADVIAERLNDAYGFYINREVLRPTNFTVENHARSHLGSEGRAVTMARCEPDDMKLFYPKTVTSLHLEIPEIDVKKDGDFSIIYDEENRNWEGKFGSYGAYLYGDKALIHLVNNKLSDGKRLLIIRDSFGEVLVPFLALGVKTIDVIDVRSFTGSVRTYIAQTRPDAVLVLYYPGDMGSRTAQMYSFR